MQKTKEPSRSNTLIRKVFKDNPSSWIRYQEGLCETCEALCCAMPVEMHLEDVVRLGWAYPDEDPQKLAKRLTKERLIVRYRHATGVFTMARKSDDTCFFLSPQKKCLAYDRRPKTCQEFPQKNSRHGYCPYQHRK